MNEALLSEIWRRADETYEEQNPNVVLGAALLFAGTSETAYFKWEPGYSFLTTLPKLPYSDTESDEYAALFLVDHAIVLVCRDYFFTGLHDPAVEYDVDAWALQDGVWEPVTDEATLLLVRLSL